MIGYTTVGTNNLPAALALYDKVTTLHAKALELVGEDEGAPRLRGGNFFAGYFRYLDGNKLCAFTLIRT